MGNPTLEGGQSGDGEAFRQRHNIPPDALCLGVLFGSRMSELTRLQGPFSDALKQLRRERPDLAVIVPLADSIADAARAAIADDPAYQGAIIVDEDEKPDAFAAIDTAMACSGTVTTQLAMRGVPTVAGYRLGWATWAVLRGFMLKSKYISLVNIAADRELIPERIQTTCTGPRLAADVGRFLDDSRLRAETSTRLIETTDEMRGEGSAAARAAAVIIELANA